MTITYEEVKRVTKPWGIEVLVKFTDDEDGQVRSCTFRFDNEEQIANEGPTRFANKVNKIIIKKNSFDNWDFGVEAVDIIKTGIIVIRNNPDVTFTQAQTWYDNNYPDALWKADKFFDMARAFLERRLGFIPTWDQFKAWVINNQIGGID